MNSVDVIKDVIGCFSVVVQSRLMLVMNFRDLEIEKIIFCFFIFDCGVEGLLAL